MPIVLAIVFKTLYKVPAADQALIITGAGAKGAAAGTEGRTYKIITGGGALVIPVLQKAQYLSMKADKAILDVEGVDNQKIPVGVRGVAIFKVGDDGHSITNAATRFLSDQEAERGVSSQMHDLVREVFHGHLRSIIGGLSVEDLIANRNELAQQTRDASADEMQKLGLLVDSLQIQEIIDPTGYIKALGEPRAAEVKMQARIAQAAADREATEREQEAETLKAAAQRDTAIKLAEFQADQDRAAATQAQAGPLADAEARKQVVVQETAVAELEAQREERRLDTQVRKPADAVRLPGARRGRGPARGADRARGGRQARDGAGRRGRRPQGRAERRRRRQARRAGRGRAGDADARGRRGGGGGDHGQGPRRGRCGARPRARRGGGDRQARRGAREGVRRRDRPAAGREAARDRRRRRERVRQGRQPDRAQRRPGDGRDHEPGDRAGRPGAHARARHARGAPREGGGQRRGAAEGGGA